MVKNTTGGNKNKSQARKNFAPNRTQRLRVAENEGEIYAIATKMLGNCRFMAKTTDNTMCIGMIRGKFSRKKRDNLVTVGTWVLLGERDWEKESDSISTCDLLEVYSSSDCERLRNAVVGVNWGALTIDGITTTATREEDNIFMTEQDEEMEKIAVELRKAATASTAPITINEECEIDIDDI